MRFWGGSVVVLLIGAAACAQSLPTAPEPTGLLHSPSRGWDTWDSVQVVAHRGYACCYPENTLEALEAAIHSGVRSVEVDVRLTADQVPVLLHDESLDRTSDRRGPLHSYTLRELDDVDVCPRRRVRCRVPTLFEALELTRGRVRVVIDLKGPFGREAVLPVVATVEDASMVDHVAFISSQLQALNIVRTRLPGAPVGLYVWPSTEGERPSRSVTGRVGSLAAFEGSEILLRVEEVRSRGEVYRAALRRGLPITVFTVWRRGDVAEFLSVPGVRRVLSDVVP